jgi:FtsP/CotA-like multicopper oxidase with cupredoxin domain
MADGRSLYSFGFADVTTKPANQIMLDSLAANFSAPTIELKQNEDFYLTLTNVAMTMRPDLFDPHTVHFHGFPQQPPVFDGMPEGSFGVNMGSSITYYYKLNDPGTYMYHCHQEATEHMQMGMLGNLYVKPSQDGNTTLYPSGKYVYNDGDGSTGYDKAYPLQLSSMDHVFHELHLGVQPLPFKNMKDTYAMINGRGYPDTVNTAALPAPIEKADYGNTDSSQPINALVTATKGERILLRLSNLSVTNYYTITAQGLPMQVVGAGARQLRGPDGKNLYYETTSVTLGGGESAEVLIDTSQVAPGTYFLYTTNLNYLSNFEQDNGGMMTEIVIN